MFIRTKKIMLIFSILVSLLLLSGCRERREREMIEQANRDIEQALGDIGVNAGSTNDVLRSFRLDDGTRFFPNIAVDIDFEKILRENEVPTNVFVIAKDHAERHINNLYNDLSLMFSRTNNLTIRAHNVDILNDYDLPPDVMETRQFPIEIGRFIESDDKFLRIETHYGNLDLYSDFFYGRTGFNETGELILIFSYFEDDVAGDTEVSIRVYSKHPNGEMIEIDVQNPGRSSLLTIPLSANFMRGVSNELLYNAVKYIDIEESVNGILPRSFIDNENLYVYFNRTGRFQLTNEAPSSVTNMTGFLRERGVILTGINEFQGQQFNEAIVTRGEMYDSLMMIHWVENLHHDFSGIRPFPDLARVPESNIRFTDYSYEQRLVQHILVGQSLEAFTIVGLPDGRFHPNRPLTRGEFYKMLAGYIEAFGIDVQNLMQVKAIADQRPAPDEAWWDDALVYLESIGFMPYLQEGNNFYLAGDEHVTVREAQEMLFTLITTRHFR